MNYRVCLEIGYDGKWVFVHVPDLMGCFSKEKERKTALEKLPERINTYIAWLNNHGENIEKSERIEIDIVEIFESYEVDGYEVNAFFEADRIPLSKEEVEKGIQRMIWSRQDLLEKSSSFSPEVLDKRLNNKWSVRRNLEHIATAEWWYLTSAVSQNSGVYSRSNTALSQGLPPL
jgi:predicted RNase H-like HicB family nuclease